MEQIIICDLKGGLKQCKDEERSYKPHKKESDLRCFRSIKGGVFRMCKDE